MPARVPTSPVTTRYATRTSASRRAPAPCRRPGLLGVPIGEMWALEQLANDCAQDRVYEFLLTSAPLNKLGGVGPPPNALAVK